MADRTREKYIERKMESRDTRRHFPALMYRRTETAPLARRSNSGSCLGRKNTIACQTPSRLPDRLSGTESEPRPGARRCPPRVPRGARTVGSTFDPHRGLHLAAGPRAHQLAAGGLPVNRAVVALD